jgi:phenylalanine-4-hydroxylase
MTNLSSRSVFDLEQIARLPRHLQRYIVEQHHERYTAIDHAAWRYIMRQAVTFHREHAHEAYLDGLMKTGISLERIPRVEEMNDILGRIGWGAAPVDGFIPPAAFMEFQAHRVLVIAADMRQVEHLEYTPAPDIVHEAAGHAPIIANEEYAEYLRRFGEYGAMAISSRQDFELYEAIRHLSILKEAPNTPPDEIRGAEQAVASKQANLGEPSEMALLSRLHWWTVEYGLIGTLDDPRLYGAGLLSSLGEATHCLTPAVRKLPYTVDAANQPFDITSMQPQLFVTPSFAHLSAVLEEFAAHMAFRLGGLEALQKAVASADVATCEYSSGLQVSGLLTDVVTDERGQPAYLRTNGPTALGVANAQLPGHGKDYHREGFGSPVGGLRDVPTPLEVMDDGDLASVGLCVGARAHLEFERGIQAAGRLERVRRERGRVVLLTFSDCRVQRGEQVLFDPAWGTYDMAVGAGIVSVFHGAADKDAYEEVTLVPRERTVKVTPDPAARGLERLYASVRETREQGTGIGNLAGIEKDVCANHPRDWLLSLEILEVLARQDPQPPLAGEIRGRLAARAAREPDTQRLITNGLRLLGSEADPIAVRPNTARGSAGA